MPRTGHLFAIGIGLALGACGSLFRRGLLGGDRRLMLFGLGFCGLSRLGRLFSFGNDDAIC